MEISQKLNQVSTCLGMAKGNESKGSVGPIDGMELPASASHVCRRGEVTLGALGFVEDSTRGGDRLRGSKWGRGCN